MTTIHEIRDNEKVNAIAESMEQGGWTGYPLLVIVRGDESLALTGVHRIAAAEKAGIELETYEIDEPVLGNDDDINRLWEDLGDAIDDHNRLNALVALNDAGEIDDYAVEIMRNEVETN